MGAAVLCNLCSRTLSSDARLTFRSCFHVFCRQCPAQGPVCPSCGRRSHHLNSKGHSNPPFATHPGIHMNKIEKYLNFGLSCFESSIKQKSFTASKKRRQFDMIVKAVRTLGVQREKWLAKISDLEKENGRKEQCLMDAEAERDDVKRRLAALTAQYKNLERSASSAQRPEKTRRMFGSAVMSPLSMSTPLSPAELGRRGTPSSNSTVTAQRPVSRMEALVRENSQRKRESHSRNTSFASPDSFHSAASRRYDSPVRVPASPTPSVLTTPVLLGLADLRRSRAPEYRSPTESRGFRSPTDSRGFRSPTESRRYRSPTDNQSYRSPTDILDYRSPTDSRHGSRHGSPRRQLRR